MVSSGSAKASAETNLVRLPAAPAARHLDGAVAAQWGARMGRDFGRGVAQLLAFRPLAAASPLGAMVLKRSKTQLAEAVARCQQIVAHGARPMGADATLDFLSNIRPRVAGALGLSEAPAQDVCWVDARQLRHGLDAASQHAAQGAPAAVAGQIEGSTGTLLLNPGVSQEVLVGLTPLVVAAMQQERIQVARGIIEAHARESGTTEFSQLILPAVVQGQSRVVGARVMGELFPHMRGRWARRIVHTQAQHALNLSRLIDAALVKGNAPAQIRTEAHFIYYCGTALALAVAEQRHPSCEMLLDAPPVTLQEVIQPDLYLTGKRPPSPKPMALEKLLPGAVPIWAFIVGLNERFPERFRSAWRGDWREEVSSPTGGAFAGAFLFETAADAAAFAQHLQAFHKEAGIPPEKGAVRAEGCVTVSAVAEGAAGPGFVDEALACALSAFPTH
ncbi:MAG: hypothetical protein ACKVPX_16820 [Myxococcaceae bacterium]